MNSMEPRTLFQIIMLFTLLGMGVDGLLTFNKLTDSNVACDAGGGCDIVTGSIYSEIAGIPVSVFGFAAFLVLLALSVAGFTGKIPSRTAWKGILAVSAVALLGAVYFIYIMVGVLQTICPWCMASHTLLAGVFILSLLGYKGGL